MNIKYSPISTSSLYPWISITLLYPPTIHLISVFLDINYSSVSTSSLYPWLYSPASTHNSHLCILEYQLLSCIYPHLCIFGYQLLSYIHLISVSMDFNYSPISTSSLYPWISISLLYPPTIHISVSLDINYSPVSTSSLYPWISVTLLYPFHLCILGYQLLSCIHPQSTFLYRWI